MPSGFASVMCGSGTRRLAMRSSARSRHTSSRCRRHGAGARHVQRRFAVRAGPVEIDDQDLLQFPDRVNWYEAKFAAADMPDWIPATYLRTEQASPTQRLVVLQHEVSRERVPIRNAYKCAGQQAAVRVNNGVQCTLPVASPPPSMDQNRDPLFVLKGDIFSEETKVVKEPLSVMSEVHLLLERDDAPEVWELEVGDAVEVGPFQGNGLDLRSSALCAIYRFPTIVLFVSGSGIASAKALLESDETVPNLCLHMRDTVHLYYLAPNEMSHVFKDDWPRWEAAGCKVVATTRSFQDAFDDDMTLAYDPQSTAAIILTGGDEEAEAAAREVCQEAEITTILADSSEAQPPVYLSSSPKSFQRWSTGA